MNTKELLRGIPKVDEVLKLPALEQADAAASALREAVREELDALRAGILAGSVDQLPDSGKLCEKILDRCHRAQLPSLRRVINGTGVILHTNLGRACLSQRAAEAAYDVARGYSTLEYDLEKGQRGLRYSHVESLLRKVTGAEAALVVNNNAAAVLLILSAMASGGEVITSRGELVEIGGSFRVPEIMEQCGCRLKEVGTTNKTHLQDYAAAIDENTRALMKVHTSNFKILGFTESVPLEEMVALGHERGLPVIEDLGSGSIVDLEQFGIHGEPTVQNSVRAGVDVISFSGDKLLGGPQAGIIIGKAEYIARLGRHPLTRAMRVDKMTLAALEATLRSYVEERAEQEIPTLSMLAARPEELRAKAQMLCDALTRGGVDAQVVEEQCQVGGGSVPAQMLPTFAVAITPHSCSVDQMEQAMRLREQPIIGRIAHDRYLIDLRTLQQEDFSAVETAVFEVLR